MGVRITESMTQVVTETGWTVRVWWTRADFEACFAEGVHTPIVDAVRANASNHESIRAALEGLAGAGDNLAAFEIRDAYGNGAVIYPNWEGG